MSKYKTSIKCVDMAVTKEELVYILMALSCSTKFCLKRQMCINTKYDICIPTVFEAFYYDDDVHRYYLLTNDERRVLIKKLCSVSEKRSSAKNNTSIIAYNTPEIYLKGRNYDRISIDNLMWHVRAKVIINREDSQKKYLKLADGEYLLISVVVATSIDNLNLSYITDSVIDTTGTELLDRIEPAIRAVACCNKQMLIRTIFPYVDKIWFAERVTSPSRYDDFKRYLKIGANINVYARLYDVVVRTADGGWKSICC